MVINNDSEVILAQLFDANLDQLMELKKDSVDWPLPYTLFHSVMISYLKLDIDRLKLLVNSIEGYRFKSNFDKKPAIIEDLSSFELVLENLYWLSYARLCIRLNDNLDKALENLSQVNPVNELWYGELFFVKALIYGYKHQYELEQFNYYQSYLYFSKSGALKKGLLAYQNSIAAESSLYPQRRFTVEYNHLMNIALKSKVYSTAGLCALNLSREYQKLKTYLVSLKLANLAVKLLKRDFGTQHYGLALCHRAELLFQMDRIYEAKQDLDEAKSIDFIEVRNACLIIEGTHLKGHTEYNTENLAAAWINRDNVLMDSSKHISFGIQEEKLIRLLSLKPETKSHLLSILYSEELKSLDYETVLNRFKNLLARVRKKDPHLILFDGKRYSLSQTSQKALLLCNLKFG